MKALLLGFGLLGTMCLAGCGSSEECKAFTTCAKTGEQVSACCTTSNCKYTVGSKQFPCDGTDCASAAQSLTSYCAK